MLVRRNHVPWAILSCCMLATALLMFVTRTYLARENARRDREGRDATYDEIYITRTKENGTIEEVKVDKVGLSHLLHLYNTKLDPARNSLTSPTYRIAISAMYCSEISKRQCHYSNCTNDFIVDFCRRRFDFH